LAVEGLKNDDIPQNKNKYKFDNISNTNNKLPKIIVKPLTPQTDKELFINVAHVLNFKESAEGEYPLSSQ
jgi:hypothetical protein